MDAFRKQIRKRRLELGLRQKDMLLRIGISRQQYQHLIFSFSNEFKNDVNRPTLSLITSPIFPNANRVMAEPLISNQRLHPLLSNLLPEGAMREMIVEGLKTHIDNEFLIMSYLGEDLPGALVAEPMDPKDASELNILNDNNLKAVKFDRFPKGNKFSLAGVQIKFSLTSIGLGVCGFAKRSLRALNSVANLTFL